MERYRQCTLERPTVNGVARLVSWIPEKFARPGRFVKLKKADQSWENGWIVCQASSVSKARDQVILDRNGHRHHRKRTDI